MISENDYLVDGIDPNNNKECYIIIKGAPVTVSIDGRNWEGTHTKHSNVFYKDESNCTINDFSDFPGLGYIVFIRPDGWMLKIDKN